MNPNKTARIYVDRAGRKRYVGSAHLKQTQHLICIHACGLSSFEASYPVPAYLGTIHRPLPTELQPWCHA